MNYVQFLSDNNVKDALVEFYTGKIHSDDLLAILKFLSRNLEDDKKEAFREYFLESSLRGEYTSDQVPHPPSSGSFAYGLYDLDNECFSEEDYSEGCKQYSDLIYRIGKAKGI